MIKNLCRLIRLYSIGFLLSYSTAAIASDCPIGVRVENLTVAPSTGPVTNILVANTSDRETTAAVSPKFPDGWRWTPSQREVTLGPGENKRVPFTIEKAVDLEANRYKVEVEITFGGEKFMYGNTVSCTSAPYYKPNIDGNFKDWADAIPVTFETDGKKTVISTYWNKEYFCLYVHVDEDNLTSYKKGSEVFDGIQFAISPRNAVTGKLPTDKCQRNEFLVVDCTGLFAKDKCFRLAKAGDELSGTQNRELESLEFTDALVNVKKQGTVTHYECAIPIKALPGIRLDVGREICFSLLVHDPDGTGVRDWGKAANLWPHQKNRLAWSRWKPDDKEQIFYDNKIEWGLCSSKH